jgi:serine/threonine protein kinase
MTPERWQHVKQVLATALELAPTERVAFLDRSYATDASLRGDMEPLMASEKRLREQFLDGAHLVAAAAAVISPDENFWVGRRVGPYKVVAQIGMGGMGEVYSAFRADDYQKVVALKFVRAGQYSGEVFNRFKNERQILAGLDHLNLAKLLDGGTSEEGMPYFVMELIDGQPITKYCNEHNLSIRERLKLFLQVCAGVHYAHQHLIIHRDIKPGNILVTADGIPKLLDFGIAKIVEPGQNAGMPDATLTGFQMLTPRYASPEQIKGEAMTIATDVYSLGVVMYELLTGRSPYELVNGNTQEIAREVSETEPEKPSLAVLRSREASESSLQNKSRAFREISFERLSRQLRGDIDNIVLMALRKEPARRYASANDLQEDIRRHLENIPVRARVRGEPARQSVHFQLRRHGPRFSETHARLGRPASPPNKLCPAGKQDRERK